MKGPLPLRGCPQHPTRSASGNVRAISVWRCCGSGPYDLRHTCITKWLNTGVPVAEVSRRAGNSPEVVHRRYAGCIDGHEELNNREIEIHGLG